MATPIYSPLQTTTAPKLNSSPAPQVSSNPFAGFGGLLSKALSYINPTVSQPAKGTPQPVAQPSTGGYGLSAVTNYIKGTPPGVKATAPTNNLKPPTNTLPPAQAAPAKPVSRTPITPSGNLSASQLAGNGGLTQNDLNSSYQTPAAPASPAPAAPAAAPAASQGYSAPNTGLYGQLIYSLANQGLNGNQAYQQALPAYNQAVNNLSNFNQNLAKANAGIESQPIPLEFQQGREQVLARQAASQQAALQGAIQQQQQALGYGLQQQGLTQQALQQAAGLAAPQLAGYNQQAFNPVSGQFGGGNSGQNPQSQAQQYAQDVLSGNRSYQDAVSAMGLYGGVGQQILDQAIRSVNPNFNFAQANTLAAQQGSIGPAYSFAKSALSNLQNIVSQLGVAQGTNIPLVNSIGDWLSTTFGVNSDKTRQYIGAVQEARNAYAQLLAASRGGTPTDYGNQATAALPDNATPNDIQAALNNLESLGGSKLNIYGNPGSSSTNGGFTSGGNSLYNF